MSYTGDKNKISTNGLPEIEKTKSKRQEFLSMGYKLFRRDGHWYAEKQGESIKIEENTVGK